MTHSRRRVCRGLAALLLFTTAAFYGHAGYLYAKAILAQRLIADAWQQSLLQHSQFSQPAQRPRHSQPTDHAQPFHHAQLRPVRPWPWADTWPIARLRYQSNNITEDLYILEGASGSSLAFGPGHMAGTAPPGTKGNSVVGGHRDTHFAFLQYLQPGDRLQVQNPRGVWQTLRVYQTQVHDVEAGPLWLDPTRHELHLITCYPFDAIAANGPLRYQVSLAPIETSSPTHLLQAEKTASIERRAKPPWRF